MEDVPALRGKPASRSEPFCVEIVETESVRRLPADRGHRMAIDICEIRRRWSGQNSVSRGYTRGAALGRMLERLRESTVHTWPLIFGADQSGVYFAPRIYRNKSCLCSERPVLIRQIGRGRMRAFVRPLPNKYPAIGQDPCMREPHRHGCASTRNTFDGNRPAMKLNERPRQREAEAGPGPFLLIDIPELRERLHQLRNIGRGDADTGVRNPEPNIAGLVVSNANGDHPS